MNTYTVQISDRKRTRTLSAHDAGDAVAAAVGNRLLTQRLDSWYDGGGSWVYECAVATGPTRGGSTPFRNIRVYVQEAQS